MPTPKHSPWSNKNLEFKLMRGLAFSARPLQGSAQVMVSRMSGSIAVLRDASIVARKDKGCGISNPCLTAQFEVFRG